MNGDTILYFTLGIMFGIAATICGARYLYQWLTRRDTDFLDAPRDLGR